MNALQGESGPSASSDSIQTSNGTMPSMNKWDVQKPTECTTPQGGNREQPALPFQTDQTFPLEVANALTHGFGIIIGIASLPVVTAISTRVDRISAIVAAAIYALCFLMMFTFSTLYHATQEPTAKFVLKKMDHISIYFLIAGTYTPFLLIYQLNAFGITLLSVLWGDRKSVV